MGFLCWFLGHSCPTGEGNWEKVKDGGHIKQTWTRKCSRCGARIILFYNHTADLIVKAIITTKLKYYR